MDKTLHDLGGILVNALPTSFIVLVLTIYLKYMLFGPMNRVLDERYRLTEGARQSANDALRAANVRVSEYEGRLNAARAEIYREQEEFLRRLHAENAQQLQATRVESERRVTEIKLGLAREAEAARAALESQSDALATRIAESILNRRAA